MHGGNAWSCLLSSVPVILLHSYNLTKWVKLSLNIHILYIVYSLYIPGQASLTSDQSSDQSLYSMTGSLTKTTVMIIMQILSGFKHLQQGLGIVKVLAHSEALSPNNTAHRLGTAEEIIITKVPCIDPTNHFIFRNIWYFRKIITHTNKIYFLSKRVLLVGWDYRNQVRLCQLWITLIQFYLMESV